MSKKQYTIPVSGVFYVTFSADEEDFQSEAWGHKVEQEILKKTLANKIPEDFFKGSFGFSKGYIEEIKDVQ
jgi:hypothetical protein